MFSLFRVFSLFFAEKQKVNRVNKKPIQTIIRKAGQIKKVAVMLSVVFQSFLARFEWIGTSFTTLQVKALSILGNLARWCHILLTQTL